MRHSPRITVIIPTYNRASIVPRAIDSVLAQTYTDYEIIVVDDASTDETGILLVNKYNNKISCIRKEKNEGLAAARNTGIRAARGVYTAFLDDDDAWLPEKLALQLKVMEEDPAVGLVYCGYLHADDNDTILATVRPEKRGNVFHDLLYQNHITGSASAVLIKTEVLHAAGYFNASLSACEDWDLWIRISRLCAVDFVDAPLVKWCVHPSNMHKNIPLMEKNTFVLLNSYRGDIPEDRRDRTFSDHCIMLAWQYYNAGNKKDCGRMLIKALEYDPLNTVYVHGEQMHDKEQTVSAAFAAYWSGQERPSRSGDRKKAYSQQCLQLAWEYYARNDMKNFRRCIVCACRYTSPARCLRLCIPFVKSFLGRRGADSIHALRKRLFPTNSTP